MQIIGFIFYVLDKLASFYVFVIVVHVILSLLVAFNVVNARNQFVAMVWQLTSRLVEPALAYIRRWLPFLRNLGGFDLSPIILLVVVQGVDIYFFERFAAVGL